LKLPTRALSVITAITALSHASAFAQTYPTKPVRFIVPSAAGGSADLIARTIGQKLTERWGQQTIVDNRAGAGGAIGMQAVAKAPPDGYTILLAGSSHLATGPALSSDLGYDPIRDFAPVSLVVLLPNILLAHPSIPAQSLKELIKLAKSRRDQITYGTPGIGTTSHILGELLNYGAGIRLLHVPYKGGSLAVADAISGHVQLVFGSVSTSLPMIKGGKLKVLGATTAKRIPILPDVPTFIESGVPGYDFVQWQGVVVPRATPPALIATLNSEMVRILALTEIREKFAAQSYDTVSSTPEEFSRFIGSEVAKFEKLVKQAGLKQQMR
jgi:tripartite-type tricarboxylate transporter receptor subunit TctC